MCTRSEPPSMARDVVKKVLIHFAKPLESRGKQEKIFHFIRSVAFAACRLGQPSRKLA